MSTHIQKCRQTHRNEHTKTCINTHMPMYNNRNTIKEMEARNKKKYSDKHGKKKLTNQNKRFLLPLSFPLFLLLFFLLILLLKQVYKYTKYIHIYMRKHSHTQKEKENIQMEINL